MDDRPPPPDPYGPDRFAPAPQRGTARERPLPLRQMGIGELIDAAIKLYRREWKVLIGIVALVLVPVSFVEGYVTRVIPGPLTQGPLVTQDAFTSAIIASAVLGLVQFVFVQPFLVAAVSRAAANVYTGEQVSVGSTFRFALTRVHSILWISILSLLATLVGFLLLIIPGFLVLVRLTFAPTVLVVEGRRGTKAIGRSWNLAKGHFWRLFGTLILAGLIGGLVAAVLSIPGDLIAQLLGPNGWPVRALGNSLALVLVTPFSTLIVVLLYFDLRIRKEGYDIEVMAQELAPRT